MATGHAVVDFDPAALAGIFASAAAMSQIDVAAQTVVARLRESSPKESGRLSRSWSARVTKVDGIPTAFINSAVSYWHIPQYGSVNVHPTRYIDAAMNRTGLGNYRPSPKG